MTQAETADVDGVGADAATIWNFGRTVDARSEAFLRDENGT